MLHRSLTLLLIAQMLFSAAYTVNTVPDPKASGVGYVSNPDSILSGSDVDALNSTIADIEKKTAAQIAVVALRSIGSETPKDFAVDLFKQWGIGQRGKDNGLLILLVLDQRRWEIESGYGLEGDLPDAVCKRIGETSFPAYFKKGEYGAGLRAAVERIGDVLMRTQTNTASPSSSAMRSFPLPAPAVNFLGIWGAISLAAAVLALIIAAIAFTQKDPYRRYRIVRPLCLPLWAVLFPIPFIALYFITRSMLRRLRRAPRKSAKTGKPMRMLSDTDEDVYLKKGQLDEESARSIEYDVWVSDAPGDVLILSYSKWFSKYGRCPHCGYRTYYTEYSHTVIEPTYDYAGTGERKLSCVSCKHSDVQSYTIAKLTRSSSSGSSSSGGSSSWGGGSSGGGGAGGSW